MGSDVELSRWVSISLTVERVDPSDIEDWRALLDERDEVSEVSNIPFSVVAFNPVVMVDFVMVGVPREVDRKPEATAHQVLVRTGTGVRTLQVAPPKVWIEEKARDGFEKEPPDVVLGEVQIHVVGHDDLSARGNLQVWLRGGALCAGEP
ncbi:hypothetical protein GQ53DRAFT_822954 [Thozetella sp. PMI_491]|nr:hypothetical protein GQ53DRAFT_822954 [Thozetella sp. PMI_491]